MTAPAQLTPEHVGRLAHEFTRAITRVPQDQPLIGRARDALALLPDPVVRELGDAAAALADLARERLRPPGAIAHATIHVRPDPPHVREEIHRIRRQG